MNRKFITLILIGSILLTACGSKSSLTEQKTASENKTTTEQKTTDENQIGTSDQNKTNSTD